MRSASSMTTDMPGRAIPVDRLSVAGVTRPTRLVSNRVREAAWAYLFLAPFFLGLLFFILGPVLAAFAISFTSWDLLSPPQWIGLANYREMMGDRLFWIALKNTVYFTVVSVPVTLLLALGLASLMNRKLRGISVLARDLLLPRHRLDRRRQPAVGMDVHPGLRHHQLPALTPWLAEGEMASRSDDGHAERDHHERLARARVQHRHLPGRVAEHSPGSLRSRGARWRWRMEPVPRHHGSAAHADDLLRDDHGV